MRGTALLASLAIVLVAASGPSTAEPPAARLVVPSTELSGAVRLEAAVVGPERPVAVQYRLDGYAIEQPVTAGPRYDLLWSTALENPGPHTLSLEARFASGAIVEAPAVAVTIRPTPPTRAVYVDADRGNDTNPGTAARPWKTLERATRRLQPGDTVFLRGTFTDQLLWVQSQSGTPDRPITFQPAPGATATITGGRMGGVIAVRDGAAWVVLDGLTVSRASGIGIYMLGAHHVAMRNLRVEDASRVCIQMLAVGDSVLEHSTVGRCGDPARNAGEAVQITGGSRNRILHNRVADGGHTGVTLLGHPDVDRVTHDNVIAHNVIANTWATGLSMSSWKVERTLIEHNVIRDAATSGLLRCGDAPCAGRFGMRPGIQTQGSNSVIRHNVIAYNNGSGIEIGAYPYGEVRQPAGQSNRIYNNTFFRNRWVGVYIFEKRGMRATGNLIANNIFYRNEGYRLPEHPTVPPFVWMFEQYHTPSENAWREGDLGGNQFRNNLVLRAPGTAGEPFVGHIRPHPILPTLRQYTLAQFERMHADASGNIEGDPGFVDAEGGDFRLRPDSPAIDRGLEVPGARSSRPRHLGAMGPEKTRVGRP